MDSVLGLIAYFGPVGILLAFYAARGIAGWLGDRREERWRRSLESDPDWRGRWTGGRG